MPHRRLLCLITLVALTACGGGDPADETPTTPEPTPTETAADDVADDGGTADEQSVDEVAAGMRDAWGGTWEGSWTNTTFGSTGSALVEISDAGITIDLGGSVFGMGDPDPVVLTPSAADIAAMTSDDGEVAFTTDLFGPITVSAGSDWIYAAAAEVPAPGIATAGINVERDGDVVTGTYEIGFDDGTSAEGTIELTRG